MIPSEGQRTVAVFIATLTIVGVVFAFPVVALQGDSSSTYTDPRAPGAVAEYRVTVVTERGDSVVQNGLKRLTLNFAADPDFSGSVSNVGPRDVDVRVGNGSTGLRSVGPVTVSTSPSGDRLTITLSSAYNAVEPGDRIVVVANDVRNTRIAIPDPQGVRQFALDVTAGDPQGNTDGPVEVRYEIDPNATAPNTTAAPSPTPTLTPNVTTSPTTATAAGTANGSAQETTATPTAKGTATATTAERTTQTTTTTTTRETTATEATATSTTAGTTTGDQQTETTGPGFGLAVALVALLAVAALAVRRRG